MEGQNASQELALQNVGIVKGFTYDPNLGLEKLTEVAQKIIDTGLCPDNLNQPGQLLAIGEMGRALKLDWMTAINNIDNIQGRPTLSYRLVGALLNRAGYGIKLIQNYAPVYAQDGVTVIDYITEMELIDMNLMDKIKKELKDLVSMPEDVRKVALEALDSYKALSIRKFSFTYSEAAAAGLMSKDNYIKRPQTMFRARCLTGMVRMYCPQVMMGFYETSEIIDIVPEEAGNVVDVTEYSEVMAEA